MRQSYVAKLASIGRHSDIFILNENKLLFNLPSGVNELYELVSANKEGGKLTRQQIIGLTIGHNADVFISNANNLIPNLIDVFFLVHRRQ